MDDTFAIAFFVGLIIAGIAALIAASNRKEAEQSAGQKIANLGIQRLIIKQANSRFYNDSFSMPQGVLVLTWEKLYFFGNQSDHEIPISTIRSTSNEHKASGTNMIIQADDETYRFYWEDEKRTVPGILSTGAGFGAGMGISKSANPNVHEWIQLIDDLRFGRLNKPPGLISTPVHVIKPPTPAIPQAQSPKSPESTSAESESRNTITFVVVALVVIGCIVGIWLASTRNNQVNPTNQSTSTIAEDMRRQAFYTSQDYVEKKLNIFSHGFYPPFRESMVSTKMKFERDSYTVKSQITYRTKEGASITKKYTAVLELDKRTNRWSLKTLSLK